MINFIKRQLSDFNEALCSVESGAKDVVQSMKVNGVVLDTLKPTQGRGKACHSQEDVRT